MAEPARSVLERAIELIGREPILLMFVGQACAALGESGKARELLAELRRLAIRRYIPPMYEAAVLAALGDLTGAFALWERAYEERSGWLVFTRAGPQWDPLRSDPRFVSVIRRVGLDF
jgi:Flp pilus assembly protein TadD